jgi:uncharacterized protein (DUF1697 family)
MQRYIALLRAINVGGHTVKMEQLRKLFVELGFASVETFIASGNVIFEAADQKPQALEQQIEGHLKQALGYAVATFIRTPAELAAVASYQPFPPAELDAAGSSLYVGFLPAPPADEAQRKLLALSNGIDDFHIHQRELYWLARQGMGKSTISGAQIEKALGLPGTLRNITTVRKLAAKYPA